MVLGAIHAARVVVDYGPNVAAHTKGQNATLDHTAYTYGRIARPKGKCRSEVA